MKKATHAGHCQACGNLQKLPKGSLSLHGYNVAHGFFSGICVGARALPYEQSCDLIRGFIRRAEDRLAQVEGQQRHLRRQATEPRAMVRVYVREGRQGRHVWQEVEVKSERHDYSDGTGEFYMTFHYGDARKLDRSNELTGALGEKDPLNVATRYNKIYADWLDHEVVSLRRYIAWQTERVETWKPAPTLELDHVKDDGHGFKPTAAKY